MYVYNYIYIPICLSVSKDRSWAFFILELANILVPTASNNLAFSRRCVAPRNAPRQKVPMPSQGWMGILQMHRKDGQVWNIMTKWWFQTFFLNVHPYLAIQFGWYFSTGLKPKLDDHDMNWRCFPAPFWAKVVEAVDIYCGCTWARWNGHNCERHFWRCNQRGKWNQRSFPSLKIRGFSFNCCFDSIHLVNQK